MDLLEQVHLKEMDRRGTVGVLGSEEPEAKRQ